MSGHWLFAPWAWPDTVDPRARLVGVQVLQTFDGLWPTRLVLSFQEPSGAVKLVAVDARMRGTADGPDRAVIPDSYSVFSISR